MLKNCSQAFKVPAGAVCVSKCQKIRAIRSKIKIMSNDNLDCLPCAPINQSIHSICDYHKLMSACFKSAITQLIAFLQTLLILAYLGGLNTNNLIFFIVSC